MASRVRVVRSDLWNCAREMVLDMKSIYFLLAAACLVLFCSACSGNADDSAPSSAESNAADEGEVIHGPADDVDLDGVRFRLTGWRTHTHSNGTTYTVLEGSATNTGESLEQWEPMVTYILGDGTPIDYTMLDLKEGLGGVFEAGRTEKLEWGFDMPPEALKRGTLKLFASDTWFGDFALLPRQPDTGIPAADTPVATLDDTKLAETEILPPPVILGDYCSDHDATAVTADGTTVYCARRQYTDAYVWYTAPGVAPNPTMAATPSATTPGPGYGDEALHRCMVMTELTRDECQAQIDRATPN